jgi:hypothetical protein
MGEGPSFRTFSTNSLHISAHLGPCAAERLYISRRAGSMPIFFSSVLT